VRRGRAAGFIAGADTIASTGQQVAEPRALIALNRERFVPLDLEERR
jgi:hypothetical protein